MATLSKEIIKEVYEMLKNREVNPSGVFDAAGRFYATHGGLVKVRSPSRAWPYSQMQACRTLKYVKAVAEAFKCEDKESLLKNI